MKTELVNKGNIEEIEMNKQGYFDSLSISIEILRTRLEQANQELSTIREMLYNLKLLGDLNENETCK